jgi:hypothetical protein
MFMRLLANTALPNNTLKALVTFRQISPHTVTAKEHRDAAVNACSEACPWLNAELFFQSLAVEGAFLHRAAECRVMIFT